MTGAVDGAELIKDKETKLQGLRPALRATFYPNYSYERALSVGAAQFASQRRATGLANPLHGSRRGKDVHDQVECYINRGRDAWVAQFGLSCSPLVHDFMTALHRIGCRPLIAEFQDFFEELAIGSSIDILCYDTKRAGLTIIELKVGGENYFERASGNLIRPAALRTVNNSPMNQGFLQLLLYRCMIEDHYPYVPIARCLLAQLQQTGTHFRRLPQKFIDAKDAVKSALARRKRWQTPKTQSRPAATRGGASRSSTTPWRQRRGGRRGGARAGRK